jgi:protein phosphatase-4 regulatory subunit 3
LTELFGLVLNPDVETTRKKDAVAFLQQCCSIAKGLQVNIRGALYQNFLNAGLFKVITFALKQPDTGIRVAGTDILIALIEHDPVMMRGHIFRSLNDKAKPLTDNLIEMLLVEPDLGVKCQMADALKVLLDPIANAQTVESITRGNGEYARRPPHQVSSSADQFVQHFYEESCRKVFAPLRELDKRPSMSNLTTGEGQLFTQLIEILCFFIRNHSYRTKSFLASEGIPFKIAKLFQCPEKHLKLLGLKYFRSTLNLHDPFHYSMMIHSNIVEPILDILLETMPKDNLLNSVCLDFFDTIRRVRNFNHSDSYANDEQQENNKDLITYLATKLRDKLEKLTYIETFRQLLQKYEAMNSAPPPDELSSFTTVETEQTPNANANRPTATLNGHRWQGLKEMDADEENYFNTSDGDEDEDWMQWEQQRQGAQAQKKGVLGAIKSQQSGPLVAYEDDDEDELAALDVEEEEVVHVNGTTGVKEPASTTAEAKALTPETSPEPGNDKTPEAMPSAAVTPAAVHDESDSSLPRDETPSPPERIVEKRKRAAVEEDEEDELTKLSSQPKRRSSLGSNLAVSGPMASVGQRTRKRTLSSSAAAAAANKENNSKGSGAVKKITISLAAKPEATVQEEAEEETAPAGNGERVKEKRKVAS